MSAETTEETTEAAEGEGPGSAPINWEHPDPTAVRVEGLAAAKSQLSFAPLSDEALGAPTDVFVSSDDIPRDFRWVTSRYDHSNWGVFLIQQQQLDRGVEQAQASLERLAGPCEKDGCAGTWELVRLANGRNALLVTGPGSEDQQTNFISFIHPGLGVRVDIEGPPAEFDGDAAIKIANVLVSS